VQLIASRFTSPFDLSDDSAIINTCILDCHHQLLMPSRFTSSGVECNDSERAAISLLEFMQDLF
jgi:hypothetical protein